MTRAAPVKWAKPPQSVSNKRKKVSGNFSDSAAPLVSPLKESIDVIFGDRFVPQNFDLNAAEIAHNVNNLLAVVSGNLQILRVRIQDRSLRNCLDEVTQACEMAARANASLFNRREFQHKSTLPINLKSIFSDLGGVLARTLGPQVELRLPLVDGFSDIRADQTELESAIINIAANSRHAMPNGGVFEIIANNVTIASNSSTSLYCMEPGAYVLLSFRDTGDGMSSDVLQSALTPHFTTKESGEGFGLGLSSVHHFVQKSGGAVILKSEVTVGTEVQIYLPAQGR
jgi:signal transduction histidine kinase